MHRQRLEHLKQIIADTQPCKLNMNVWSCGTVHCALGAAACDPEFMKQGLQLVTVPVGDGPDEVSPCYENQTGFSAGAAFFNMTFAESVFLFNPASYHDDEPNSMEKIGKNDVINHIDKLLKKMSRYE